MKMLLFQLILFSLSFTATEAAITASKQYVMDQRSDCINTGFIDMPRDQTTYVRGRSSQSSQSQLTCYLQFSPQTEGDTLKLWIVSGSYIQDCDVILEIQMSNNDKKTLGCQSNLDSIPEIKDINGKATIRLTRKTYDDVSYSFQIGVTALRSEAAVAPGDASSGNIGMIVGIVAGIIVVIVVTIIICVCCYKKYRNKEAETVPDYKKEVPSKTIYENNSLRSGTLASSPGSEKKLLGKDQQDNLESGAKPRSALDRFGPPPGQNQRSNQNYENRNFGRNRADFQENKVDETKKIEPVMRRDIKREPVSTRQGPPPPPPIANLPGSRSPSTSSTENQLPPPKTGVLAALHNNPKFRKSFHENERDADERVKRVSQSISTTSSSSINSAGAPLSKPKLPPLPTSATRSPSPEKRGHVAAIHRARPSSSSSDTTQIDDKPAPKPAHQDKQHALRPNREKKVEPKPEVKKRKDRSRDTDESEDSDRERKNKSRSNSRHRDQEENERGRKKDERKYREEDEERGRTHDKEYEGRFKKSASGRKPKSKGQKMVRSKSTGNAIEALEANNQPARSKSSGSVRSLNFTEDDEEDDDLDSNYMPFKRSGSKTSLYASRSSLYGRKRKNSMGETVSLSSYAYDDMDSRMGDFDREKSSGDMATAVVVRECATWTGNDKGVYVFGRKSLAKTRHGKRYNRGVQTSFPRERKDSVGSTKSGVSVKSNHLKSRSKSQESLRKHKRSRSRDDVSVASSRSKSVDRDSSEEDKKRHHRSRSRMNDSDDDDDRKSRKKRSHSKSREMDTESEYSTAKPKHRGHRSTGSASVGLSSSNEDVESVAASSVAPSVNPSSAYLPHQQPMFAPPLMPVGYPMPYQQFGVPYIAGAPGGPPVMVPMPGVAKPPIAPKPAPIPQPQASKWDQLVNLTEGMKKRRHQMGESIADTADTESVLSSTWGQPYPAQQPYYSPPSYTTAQSSAYSGPASYAPLVDRYGNNYGPSESNI
ncbi:serine/arginine repetitive matrix protein 5-like [Physella acuta]|uniref:serine/arginine repetitive matrix protein 5-like n=1 Tax=Physella acuta TaxID=109671 RepID=UPI0027DD6877|nr:serine/arginine repetitive matrix protein 5-like [Physella acuta]